MTHGGRNEQVLKKQEKSNRGHQNILTNVDLASLPLALTNEPLRLVSPI